MLSGWRPAGPERFLAMPSSKEMSHRGLIKGEEHSHTVWQRRPRLAAHGDKAAAPLRHNFESAGRLRLAGVRCPAQPRQCTRAPVCTWRWCHLWSLSVCFSSHPTTKARAGWACDLSPWSAAVACQAVWQRGGEHVKTQCMNLKWAGNSVRLQSCDSRQVCPTFTGVISQNPATGRKTM